MSLQDEYQALETPKRGCIVCDWYRQQSEDDQAFFRAMAVGQKARLHRACTAMGLEAHVTTLRECIRDGHVTK